ncbi:Endonuclease/exonuclease/phosphatase [Cubamyces lactineus]|nr:Endonuclease/exonuclease/phosphatase [Cubamyces lactineus]
MDMTKPDTVLAVQETHLTNERAQDLRALFSESLRIEYSQDPTNAGAARGVAFIINLRIVKEPIYTIKEIIPGRAILIELQWAGDKKLRILNVYGPNPANDNADFWKKISDARLRGIDIMLGDFNFVEDPVDRLPAREDRTECVEAFGDLKEKYHLIDGWRMTHTNEKAYTYVHTNGTSHSRIDRIYIKRTLFSLASNWDLTEAGIATDHRLAFVEMVDYKAPYIGKGRWSAPVHLMTDEKMRGQMQDLAKSFIDELKDNATHSQTKNPQTVYLVFKKKLINALRARAKEKIPRMNKRLEALRTDRDKTLNSIQEMDPERTKEKLTKYPISNGSVLRKDGGTWLQNMF